jgi:hypothetical protein
MCTNMIKIYDAQVNECDSGINSFSCQETVDILSVICSLHSVFLVANLLHQTGATSGRSD